MARMASRLRRSTSSSVSPRRPQSRLSDSSIRSVMPRRSSSSTTKAGVGRRRLRRRESEPAGVDRPVGPVRAVERVGDGPRPLHAGGVVVGLDRVHNGVAVAALCEKPSPDDPVLGRVAGGGGLREVDVVQEAGEAPRCRVTSGLPRQLPHHGLDREGVTQLVGIGHPASKQGDCPLPRLLGLVRERRRLRRPSHGQSHHPDDGQECSQGTSSRCADPHATPRAGGPPPSRNETRQRPPVEVLSSEALAGQRQRRP